MDSRQDRSTHSSELPVFGTGVATPCEVTEVPQLLKFHAPEIVFGPGSLAEAGSAAERQGAHRPFVTDPGLMATEWVNELLGLDYAGVEVFANPIPPLPMIPSTAGTGADVSQFCVITDMARSIKVSLIGRAPVPDVSITDPRLPVTMPAWLAAGNGPGCVSARNRGLRLPGAESPVPRGLRHLEVTEGNIGHPAMSTSGDACLSTNPRSADRRDVEALFLAAL